MEQQENPTVVYRFKHGLYINLTNYCPNLCVFCIKTKWRMRFDGHNLNLQNNDPSAETVLAELDREMQKNPAQEIVFCGYGESTARLPQLLEVCRVLREKMACGQYPPFKIRLNTNGLGNLLNKRDIVPDLKKAVDEVYVSLNAQDEETWRGLVRPAEGYEDGFASVVEFTRLCARAGFDKVVASCVDKTGADAAAVKALAEKNGAEFYLRSFLDEEN